MARIFKIVGAIVGVAIGACALFLTTAKPITKEQAEAIAANEVRRSGEQLSFDTSVFHGPEPYLMTSHSHAFQWTYIDNAGTVRLLVFVDEYGGGRNSPGKVTSNGLGRGDNETCPAGEARSLTTLDAPLQRQQLGDRAEVTSLAKEQKPMGRASIAICAADRRMHLLSYARRGRDRGNFDSVRIDKGAVAVAVEPSADAATKRLQVSVQPDGAAKAVSGSADVAGFPIINAGTGAGVEWKVSGSTITGTLRTADGEVEGTFNGTITASGVSGTFTHRDGRVGMWSWNGPAPATNGK